MAAAVITVQFTEDLAAKDRLKIDLDPNISQTKHLQRPVVTKTGTFQKLCKKINQIKI